MSDLSALAPRQPSYLYARYANRHHNSAPSSTDSAGSVDYDAFLSLQPVSNDRDQRIDSTRVDTSSVVDELFGGMSLDDTQQGMPPVCFCSCDLLSVCMSTISHKLIAAAQLQWANIHEQKPSVLSVMCSTFFFHMFCSYPLCVLQFFSICFAVTLCVFCSYHLQIGRAHV